MSTGAMAARAPVVQRDVSNPGWVARALRAISRLISMLVLALIFSIALEWIGMIAWWPEEGVRHSERMLAWELRYLNEDFADGILALRPGETASRAAALVRQGLDAVGVGRLFDGLEGSTGPLASWSATIPGHVISRLRIYAEAMGNVMQTFVVRVTVLALATPVFALFGVVGLAEGLMIRDLRRWGGGRESSFLYHHSKKLLGPSILAAWMLYLAVPFSVHPNLALLPFATLFAASVAVTTATFKKYL